MKNSKIQLLLFFLAVIAALTPLIAFSFFPSADGPAHVLNASLLRRLLLEHDPLVSSWYTLNPVVVPNWSGHLLLMGLLSATAGPVAERLLIALYLISFLLAFRYAIRAVTLETRGLEFIGFAFIYNMHVYWGFYNFCLSLGILLWILGYVLRHEISWSARDTLRLTFLAILLYLSHGLMFLFCLMTLFLVSAVKHWGDWPVAFKRGLSFLLSFSFPLALFVHYYLFRVNKSQDVTEWPTIRYSASLLGTLSPLSAFDSSERYLPLVFSVAIYGSLALRMWQLRGKWRTPELLVVFLFGVFSVFAFPVTTSGGTMTTPRLIYLPAFAAILWLAANSLPKQWSLGLAFLSLTVCFALQWQRLPLYRAYDSEMTTLMSSLSGRLQPGGVYWQNSGKTLGPFTNSGNISLPDLSSASLCFLGVSTGAATISNYEAAQDHFPLLFVKGKDPYKNFYEGSNFNPDLLSESRAEKGSIDGVLLWCHPNESSSCDAGTLTRRYIPQPLSNAPNQARWFVRKP